ncbi:MAG: sulfite exporter TauE/SafE family protein [Candidatus Omnitrophota bacterium]
MGFLFLLKIGFIGFVAQIIDGALGMGYGVFSSSFLISLGFYPAIVSASVHTSEVFTTFASGISHLKFGNVEKRLVKFLTFFGVLGAILGVCGVVKISSEIVTPAVSIILLIMGFLILINFIFRNSMMKRGARRYPKNRFKILGLFAGFIDAIGGGGWGPVCTTTLIVDGIEPNKVIGSVNFAEFFVTLVMSITFFSLLKPENFRWDIVLALTIGGIISAPFSAFICKRLPKRILGILVGLLVIILSAWRLWKF